MSRDHDAPLEYLRILASLKLRFGLATLVTAHGELPVVYPIEEQGHSATQCLRGILTFPTVALVVKLPNERYGPSSGNTCRAEHPSRAGYDHMVAGSGRLPTPHALLPTSNNRAHFSCSIVQASRAVANPS